MPYTSWNIYYYDRPYQFRHASLSELGERGASIQDLLWATYDEARQRNAPEFGNVGALEFSVLPGRELIVADEVARP